MTWGDHAGGSRGGIIRGAPGERARVAPSARQVMGGASQESYRPREVDPTGVASAVARIFQATAASLAPRESW